MQQQHGTLHVKRTIEEEAAEQDDAILYRAQRKVLNALQAAGHKTNTQAAKLINRLRVYIACDITAMVSAGAAGVTDGCLLATP